MPDVALWLYPDAGYCRTAAAAGTLCQACVRERFHSDAEWLADWFIGAVFGIEIAGLIEVTSDRLFDYREDFRVGARRAAPIRVGSSAIPLERLSKGQSSRPGAATRNQRPRRGRRERNDEAPLLRDTTARKQKRRGQSRGPNVRLI